MVVYGNLSLLHVCGAQNAVHRLLDRSAEAIRSSSVSAGRTVTSTSADSAAPAEASFRITTKIPPCMFFNISCCLQQIFLD